MPRIETVKVAHLTVGDVLTDGARITDLGPSSLYPGERFISAKLPDGGRWTTALPYDEHLQVNNAPNA